MANKRKYFKPTRFIQLQMDEDDISEIDSLVQFGSRQDHIRIAVKNYLKEKAWQKMKRA